jgi:hypothetical protein
MHHSTVGSRDGQSNPIDAHGTSVVAVPRSGAPCSFVTINAEGSSDPADRKSLGDQAGRIRERVSGEATRG